MTCMEPSGENENEGLRSCVEATSPLVRKNPAPGPMKKSEP